MKNSLKIVMLLLCVQVNQSIAAGTKKEGYIKNYWDKRFERDEPSTRVVKILDADDTDSAKYTESTKDTESAEDTGRSDLEGYLLKKSPYEESSQEEYDSYVLATNAIRPMTKKQFDSFRFILAQIP